MCCGRTKSFSKPDDKLKVALAMLREAGAKLKAETYYASRLQGVDEVGLEAVTRKIVKLKCSPNRFHCGSILEI